MDSITLSIESLGALLGGLGALSAIAYAGYTRVQTLIDERVESLLGERMEAVYAAIELADRPTWLRRHRNILVITDNKERPLEVERQLRAAGWRNVSTLTIPAQPSHTPEVDAALAVAGATASTADLMVLDRVSDAVAWRLADFMPPCAGVWFAPFPMRVNLGLFSRGGGDWTPANSQGNLLHWVEAVLARQPRD